MIWKCIWNCTLWNAMIAVTVILYPLEQMDKMLHMNMNTVPIFWACLHFVFICTVITCNQDPASKFIFADLVVVSSNFQISLEVLNALTADTVMPYWNKLDRWPKTENVTVSHSLLGQLHGPNRDSVTLSHSFQGQLYGPEYTSKSRVTAWKMAFFRWPWRHRAIGLIYSRPSLPFLHVILCSSISS